MTATMGSSGERPLSLDAVFPTARLAPYVSAFELFSAPDGSAPAPALHFAGGTVVVPLSFGDPPLLLNHGPAAVRPAALLGPKRRADPIVFAGRVDVVNVSFRPGAAAAFVGLSMTELTGRLAAPDDVWPAAFRQAVAELEPLGTAQRVERLERLLLDRLDPRRARRPQIGEAVRLILATGGRISIARLAAAVNLSVSQLERAFKVQVGVSPKLLARQRRAYSVVRVARRLTAPDWGELAAAHGYADQSHLVREFHELVGLTPGAFARARPNAEYLQDTAGDRRIA
jgi:AraC-like DNA-binding protein